MFNVKIENLVLEAVEANEQALTDLNREQMRRGMTAEGTAIVPDLRNKLYADAKKQAGGRAPFGTPDLYLTGSFQERMQMDVDSRSYEFGSTDEKADKLSEKYANIFGLTKENKDMAKVITTKTLGELWRKAVGI